NVVNAHLLKGKLMLINGEIDDNVDPASSLQVVKALINANKSFEMMYMPGYGHSLGGSYEMRLIHDFFVKNILHLSPPERN
ncbi:MAG: alpha/beta hydrolase family protein, partial [Tannerellaceae bacterium]